MSPVDAIEDGEWDDYVTFSTEWNEICDAFTEAIAACDEPAEVAGFVFARLTDQLGLVLAPATVELRAYWRGRE